MTICIFAGTFNPIHNGHIKMAEYALKTYGFEKIIFIPSYLPPHKNIETNLADHRLIMTKLATSFNSKFEVSDIEYKNSQTSYSVFTIKKIIKDYSLKDRLNFIIGSDAFVNINTWYHSNEIKPIVHFIVFPRRESDDEKKYQELRKQGWDFEIAKMDYVEVSSTNIRKFNDNNIPNKVEEYISKNELYKN